MVSERCQLTVEQQHTIFFRLYLARPGVRVQAGDVSLVIHCHLSHSTAAATTTLKVQKLLFAAPKLSARQPEGRIGADSAASYVELGRCASRHTHRVELHSWPASSRCVLSFETPQLLSPLHLHARDARVLTLA